jgi:hypothetical protein
MGRFKSINFWKGEARNVRRGRGPEMDYFEYNKQYGNQYRQIFFIWMNTSSLKE